MRLLAKSTRIQGFVLHFLPLIFLVAVLFWTNSWIKHLALQLGVLIDWLIFIIAMGAGIVLIAEGFKQKGRAESINSGISGMALMVFIGSVIILSAVLQVTGLYDLTTGTGDAQVFFSIMWILAVLVFAVLTFHSVLLSSHAEIVRPHKIHSTD